MKIRIAVVGRLKAGPEKSLIDDYLTRFDRTGRALGLGPTEIVEVEAKKGGMAAEGELLEKAVAGAGRLIAMDERGKVMTSPDFADHLARFRDDGAGDLAIIIGGADGIAPDLRAKSDLTLSFGKMVWPHMLARVMLSEQLYRASTILAGGPYHRV